MASPVTGARVDGGDDSERAGLLAPPGGAPHNPVPSERDVADSAAKVEADRMELKRQTDPNIERLQRVVYSLQPVLWAFFVLITVFYLAWLVAESIAIHLYTAHRHDTPPCEQPLPMWLAVSGSTGVVLSVVVLCVAAIVASAIGLTLSADAPRDPGGEVLTMGVLVTAAVGGFCVCCLWVFSLAWQIYGSILVYALPRTRAGGRVCADDLYSFTWWYVTCGWFTFACLLVLLLVVFLIAVACGRVPIDLNFPDPPPNPQQPGANPNRPPATLGTTGAGAGAGAGSGNGSAASAAAARDPHLA